MAGDVISLDDILDEIGAYFADNTRQPGDLDCYQLAERFGCKREFAAKKIKDIVADNPAYTEARILEDGHWKVVLRRVKE
jgi:hypothetical protein